MVLPVRIGRAHQWRSDESGIGEGGWKRVKLIETSESSGSQVRRPLFRLQVSIFPGEDGKPHFDLAQQREQAFDDRLADRLPTLLFTARAALTSST